MNSLGADNTESTEMDRQKDVRLNPVYIIVITICHTYERINLMLKTIKEFCKLLESYFY